MSCCWLRIPDRLDGTLTGDLSGVRRVVGIDQKPIGRTPRSNVATYTGLFDHVRRRFAQTAGRGRGATTPVGSRSTWPADAAPPARARGR